MTLIMADGQPVEPVESDLFLVGVAETYDVIITLPSNGTFEFRATAHDGSGHTSTWVGSGPSHPAKNIPKPNLYEPMEHGDMGSIFALTPAGTMGMPDSAVEAGMFDKPGMSHEMPDAPDLGPKMDHGGHGTAHGSQQQDRQDTTAADHASHAASPPSHVSPIQVRVPLLCLLHIRTIPGTKETRSLMVPCRCSRAARNRPPFMIHPK